MSSEDESFRRQTGALAQVRLLQSGARSRWRRFVVLEWTCSRCHDPLLEVMSTTPPCLVTRPAVRADDHPAVAARPAPDDPRGHLTRYEKANRLSRTARRALQTILVEELAGMAAMGVDLVTRCRCRTYPAAAAAIVDDLGTGRRHRIV